MARRIVWTEQAKADIRNIEQSIALQILKTLARYVQTGERNTKQLQGVEPPLIRLRAQDHRVFFRDKGDHSGPKRGNGAYWGYKWQAKKEFNRTRRENAKREVRDATNDVIKEDVAVRVLLSFT